MKVQREQVCGTALGDKTDVTLSCILVLIIVIGVADADCNARRGGPLFHDLSMFLFLGSVPEGDQVQLGHGPVMPTQGDVIKSRGHADVPGSPRDLKIQSWAGGVSFSSSFSHKTLSLAGAL